MPRVSNWQALVRCFFDYGIMIYASAFLDSRPLSDDELPPWMVWFWGNFSDAALTFFSAADFTNLAAVPFESPGADVSSDAVKPLKLGKAARLRLFGASSEAGVGGV